MKRATLITFLISATGFLGCDLTTDCGECFTPPQPIWMTIVNTEGDNLITTGQFSKDSIKLFYFENQQKKVVPFDIISFQSTINIIQSSDMAWLCINKKTDFYIYLNYLDTDTLTLELTRLSDDCCTSHPIKSFTINGETATMSNLDYTFLIKKFVNN